MITWWILVTGGLSTPVALEDVTINGVKYRFVVAEKNNDGETTLKFGTNTLTFSKENTPAKLREILENLESPNSNPTTSTKESRKSKEEVPKPKTLEKIKEEMEKAQGIFGKIPTFSDGLFSGIYLPYSVENKIKRDLLEPKSFEGRKRISITPVSHPSKGDRVRCWRIIFTYSGKNTYGGTAIGYCVAWLRGGDLIDLETYTPSELSDCFRDIKNMDTNYELDGTPTFLLKDES
jgi:hypothetical protein